MSGFAALISPGLKPANSELMDLCQQEIATCCDDYLGRWKSITADMRFGWLQVTDDTETEQMPFTIDKQVYITGDVRLDHRNRLITQLQKHFANISSRTPDAYLVLYAYHYWGEALMQHLTGDFSFAIWNEHTQTLFCARDHFGIIPLYYAQTPHGFWVTNFYRALKQVPGVMGQLDDEVLRDYFFIGKNESFDHTIYKSISKLPPAHQLVYRNGVLTISAYWEIPAYSEPVTYKTTEECASHFYRLFEQSVADRTRNSSISCHLSGGMDSSSITAVSKKLLQAKYGDEGMQLTAYNYTSGQPVIESEGFFSDLIARHLQIPIRHYLADEPAGNFPEEDKAWFPEPAGASAVAAEGSMIGDTLATTRITLCGFGGDPLFEYHPLLWLKDAKQGHWSSLLRNGVSFLKTHGRLPPIDLTGIIKKRMKTEQVKAVAVPAWFKPGFFTDEYLARKQTLMISPQRTSSGMFQHPFWSYLFEMSHPGFSGVKMKYRQPFFSLDLFLFLRAVPPHLLYKKLLLRLAMLPYLPAAVLHRQKTLAYGISPLHNFNAGGTISTLKTKLPNLPASLSGIVEPDLLLAEVNDPVSLKAADFNKIGALINLLIWNSIQR
ncbi:asparagine synthase-related protein [Mucilaginibacter sp.]